MRTPPCIGARSHTTASSTARMDITLAVAFVSSLLLTGVLVALAPRLGLLDLPGKRSLHAQVTPRGGGLGFALLLPLLLWFSTPVRDTGLLVWCAGLVGMALLGLADDRHNLPARLRFAVQASLVGLLVAAHAEQVQQQLPLWQPFALLLVSVALLWLVNLYNFMDGINGIAAVQALCALLGAAWLGGWQQPSLLLAAAAVAGFLPWNFPRARIFMGDAGSLTLGYLLAGLALRMEVGAGSGLWVMATLLVPFGVDATLTLARRAWRRESLATAHRTHLYQRLALLLGSHVPVTLGVALLNLALLPAAAWVAGSPDGFGRMALVYVLAGLGFLALSAAVNRFTAARNAR